MITFADAVDAAIRYGRLDVAGAETAVRGLLGTGKWSEEAIVMGFRAGFKCEYCERDLLRDADTYKTWQKDHLIPQHAAGSHEIDNLVLACTACNYSYKNRFDPRKEGEAFDRGRLLAQVKEYVTQRRVETEAHLSQVRAWVRRGTGGEL
jgi:5-methylcytosine-specific restriction endonuclease McrA